ncbi:TIGR00341 family protein [Pontibacter chitinilyticus]|uniref:TIGR00341 family protein n=1 Tax=Pontibacter chitinilyticus TaxID=2674989 RepID=UPI00321B9DDB
MKELILIHEPLEEQVVRTDLLPLFTAYSVKLLPFRIDCSYDLKDAFLITYLGDESLVELVSKLLKQPCTLGFLPHPGMKEAQQGFGIADDLEQAVEDIEQIQGINADVLLCNGRPVFNKVVIGDNLSLMSGSVSKKNFFAFFEKVTNMFRQSSTLIPRAFTLTTPDKPGFETAALGIIAVLHGKNSLLSRKLLNRTFLNDGRLHALILAPRSILELLDFYLKSVFERNDTRKLPSFIGHIKTKSICIQCPDPMDFSQDNSLMSAREIEFQVCEEAFTIIPGRYLQADAQTGEPAEMYRVGKLPKGEAYLKEIIGKPLSLIYHASTEEFRDLFKVLRDNSTASSTYLTLMILSTLLATLGLFSNSSPVIIGAMILAPLMGPIISLSMGVLRQEKKLMLNSARTIGMGLLLSYLAAIMLTLLTPLHTMNHEIVARIRPNLLDLGVAIVSGIAGAYAHAREDVAKTLAGVAIAVALVPPLAVSGIGIGWADWDVFTGALLLFATNLAGIVLAGTATFMLLGFSPFHLAKKGLIFSMILVVLLCFPLGFGFASMVHKRGIANSLEGYQVGNITIKDVAVLQDKKPMLLSIRLLAKDAITNQDLDRIKKAIQRRIGQEVQLEIVVSITR